MFKMPYISPKFRAVKDEIPKKHKYFTKKLKHTNNSRCKNQRKWVALTMVSFSCWLSTLMGTNTKFAKTFLKKHGNSNLKRCPNNHQTYSPQYHWDFTYPLAMFLCTLLMSVEINPEAYLDPNSHSNEKPQISPPQPNLGQLTNHS